MAPRKAAMSAPALKKIRADLRYTQTEMAKALAISLRQYQHLEAAGSVITGPIAKLAKLLRDGVIR